MARWPEEDQALERLRLACESLGLVLHHRSRVNLTPLKGRHKPGQMIFRTHYDGACVIEGMHSIIDALDSELRWKVLHDAVRPVQVGGTHICT